MTEGQLLFRFVEDYPEVARGMLRDLLQQEVQQYVQRRVELTDEKLEQSIKSHIDKRTKEVARRVFDSLFTNPDEPGELQIKRDATAHILEQRRSVYSDMVTLNYKLDKLDAEFRAWIRGGDDPDRESWD